MTWLLLFTSLLRVCLGRQTWITIADRPVPYSVMSFSCQSWEGKKKKKKRAANHLLPALIASWLHSLFWLKVQLLHGWFLPRNCRTIARSSIFCIRGVTNQEETSDAVKHCLWGKNLLEVLYVWALMGLISLPVRWGLYFVGVLVMHYCVIFKSSLLCNQRVGCKSLYFMWRHLLFRWVRHTEEWWVISHE